jgi:aldose 1-epimerase
MPYKVTVNRSQLHPVITLFNKETQCSAEIYAFGGLLNKFSIPVNGEIVNVIDGYSSVEDVVENITNGFKSARLSPFTCRMNKGEYHLDQQEYKIEKFYLPPHAIHGITYDAVYDVTDTYEDDKQAFVTLHYRYTALDKGYPFSYDVTLKWKLEADNKISVRAAVYHLNKQNIPYAEGWHPYFNLGTSVNDCSLQFDSNTMLEFDETLIPTGKKINDERFVKGAVLGETFLDNCFELNHQTHAKCVLSNQKIQLTILPETSYPYLQIYTPPHRQSIAIENLSGIPDAFNNGIGLKLLEPNQTYTFATSYILKAL